AAASAGLLAFLSDASGHKTLLLANPITRLLAALPLGPTQRLSPTVGLAAGSTSIIAVVAGDDLVSPFAVKNISVDTFVADPPAAVAARGARWGGCRRTCTRSSRPRRAGEGSSAPLTATSSCSRPAAGRQPCRCRRPCSCSTRAATSGGGRHLAHTSGTAWPQWPTAEARASGSSRTSHAWRRRPSASWTPRRRWLCMGCMVRLCDCLIALVATPCS
uniref:Uncharacterized protein n=1 Tax=Aegilops tauschii subsp. strangulata TaxID=200361 RepID=A0A453T090_AEGTS